MRNLLPARVLREISKHIRERIADAEYGFQFAAGDEDSVTGALGQSLLVRPQDCRVGNQILRWSFIYRKIRGRGPHAPEKRTGADGIFQLEVYDEHDRLLRRKGLLFQSKINWTGADAKLGSQAEDLGKFSDGAIVIDYTPRGYWAVPVRHVQAARGNRREITGNDNIQPLAEVLSRDYLYCVIGQPDLYYDPSEEMLSASEEPRLYFEKDAHQILTTIRRLPVRDEGAI